MDGVHVAKLDHRWLPASYHRNWRYVVLPWHCWYIKAMPFFNNATVLHDVLLDLNLYYE